MIRSYLFVPGERPERFQKAWDAGADAVIIDLEDGVTPANKVQARKFVIEWLSANQPVYVRLNGPESEWFADDLTALANRSGLRGVVLPKAESVDQVNRVAAFFPKGVDVLPMVETAKGVSKAAELAHTPGVERLGFGALDLQADVGIEGDGEELLYARSRVVMASRVAGILSPVDSVTTALDDIELLKDNVQRARRLGFGAKFCIHPKQIPTVHEGFAPTSVEIAWAKEILAAVAAADKGAIRHRGQMVERPIVDRARRILEQSR